MILAEREGTMTSLSKDGAGGKIFSDNNVEFGVL
jgi:hypothetical protein